VVIVIAGAPPGLEVPCSIQVSYGRREVRALLSGSSANGTLWPSALLQSVRRGHSNVSLPRSIRLALENPHNLAVRADRLTAAVWAHAVAVRSPLESMITEHFCLVDVEDVFNDLRALLG
jgi:hypothetical protein